ncbi:hypothetical protein KO498_17485 [Lentibacter algarum]|uniref:hypothetical protein n=1 Tax=Lentibacter algarum TaxID=576131 RepID=UPI001C085FC4|nr:hypothetical protein [Lentibacter algarum]MBU2983604.1 hypothetical protein [Lentibacter algarum]
MRRYYSSFFHCLFKGFALTVALGVTLAPPVSAFTAVNRLHVQPTGQQGQFEVISSQGAGPRQIWCAGANFARSALGVAGNTRLYISKGLSPSAAFRGRKSVIFTVAPSAALRNGPRLGDGGNYSVSLTKAGFNLSANHAEGFCEDVWTDFD